MAQDDNLEHYLTTSRDKIHGKNFGGFKWGPKFEFLPFSQGWTISSP